MKQNISIYDVKEDLEGFHKRYHIIDVRTLIEYEPRHIPEAVNIPLHHFEHALEDLRKLSDEKPLLLYCEHGRRSEGALAFLQEHGVDNVAHITEGFYLWNII